MEVTMLDFRHRMGDIEAALARRERVNVRSHGRRWAVLIAWEDAKALDAIDAADARAISAVTYMELLQGVRNRREMLEMKRFLGRLGFAVLPVDAGISNRAACIMEETALKSDLGICDYRRKEDDVIVCRSRR